MWTARTIEEARAQRGQLTGRVAVVPTMGALHDGHMRLIEVGQKLADHVLVTLFVNPTQFGKNEDYSRYPRRLDEDTARCRSAGVSGMFVPSVDEMYPADQLPCAVDVPSLTTGLEALYRPGHFTGVCRVVAKLLNILGPQVACFGQKDFQQLRVIGAMVRDLAMPVEIIGVPTVRELDGLALSSRNAYLVQQHDAEAGEAPRSRSPRREALGLYKALSEAKALIEDGGETDPAVIESAMRQVMHAYGVEVDYAAVRHPHTLLELDCIEPRLSGGVVCLVAGRVGGVRLLDNMLIGVVSPDAETFG